MTDRKAILCLDIDGTLIDTQERVHPGDVRMINNLPDALQLILTTGRILHSAKGVLKQNGICKKSTLHLPGVFMNGGAAYLPGELLCLQHSFSHETLNRLVDLARVYPTTTFTFFGLNTVYLVNPTEFGVHIAQIHHLQAQKCLAQQVSNNIIKVMVLEQDDQLLKNIATDARTFHAEMAYSLPYAFEINPPGITKARSLVGLLQAMHLESLPIHVVGDGENDLSLFKIAQTSFAPDTAHSKVLNVADFIVPRQPDGLLTPILEML